MKKIILALAVIFTVSTAVAQTPEQKDRKAKKVTPEQRAQKSTDKLNEIVTLTDDQKTKVNALALTRAQKVDAIREKYKGQPDQRETAKSEIKGVHKEYRKAVKPLLTPEQLEKLKAHHKANHPKGPKKGKKPPVTPEPTGGDSVEDMIPSDDGQ